MNTGLKHWRRGKPSVFVSVPSTYSNDICVIFGHNDFAQLLLEKQMYFIPERMIFIIACRADVDWDAIKGDKEVFFPNNDLDVENRYSKEEHHMDFDPTDTELYLYRSHIKKEPYDKLFWAFKLDR